MSKTGGPTIQQLFDLSGRTAVVTGGTGHLGTAFAHALAEAGASVVVTSRVREQAEQAASRLPSVGAARHAGVALDHMSEASIDAAIAEILRERPAIDVLVNNGHEALAKDLTQVSGDEFSRHLINATGYFLLARHVRDAAVRDGRGASIVMLGSMYGQVASYPDAYAGVCNASPVAYHMLKGGIIHMTRHLAAYWAPDGVRVNCLSPGPFPSEKAPVAMVDRLTQKLPMKRMGEPFELKGAIVFLASNASSFMTGQNLTIDGGWTAW